MAELSGAGAVVLTGTAVVVVTAFTVVVVTAARPPHPVLAPALPLPIVKPVAAIAATAIPAARRVIRRGFQEVPEVGLFDVMGWVLSIYRFGYSECWTAGPPTSIPLCVVLTH
jgi:hypothetical protein